MLEKETKGLVEMLVIEQMGIGRCWRECMANNDVANNDWLRKVATLETCNSCKIAKSVEEKRSTEIAEIKIAMTVIAEFF
jgi:hypothetical protein